MTTPGTTTGTTTDEHDPAALRLLDVLLAEELRAADAAAARPTPRRNGLAAALLIGLGLAALAGVWATTDRAGHPADAGAQDPQDPALEVLEPATAAELALLLPALEAVIVGPPVTEPVGDLLLNGHVLIGRPREQLWSPVEIREPTELVQWMDLLRTSAAHPVSPAGRDAAFAQVRLRLLGRRLVVLQLHVRTGSLRGAGDLAFTADDALRRRIEAAAAEGKVRGRRAASVAVTEDDLRALPVDLRALECRDLPAAALRAELPRFTRLESLRCVVDANRPPQADEALVLPILAALPGLHTLAISECFVTSIAARQWQTMPELRELEIVRNRTEPPALPQLPVRSGLPQGPERSRLHLLPDLLPRLPSLRVLRLVDCHGTHPAIDAVLHSHLEELHLVRTGIALDDLRRLADLPTLRVLHFDLIRRNEEAEVIVRALGTLRQLRTLVVTNDSNSARIVGWLDEETLRAALPGCDVSVARPGAAAGNVLVLPVTAPAPAPAPAPGQPVETDK
ncbi:MAG: hypothetical protein AB7O97_14720 [Planctomycetota bacterium]